MTGVPKFSQESDVTSICLTCIQAKQTKASPGHISTRTETIAHQGLSIDFSFAGQTSDNASSRRKYYEGFNGETYWILITDHYTSMKYGDTRTSKASPLKWLNFSLSQYSLGDNCKDKYVHMDQGGELCNNPDARNLFTSKGYQIRSTGIKASCQNGPVERAHQTLSNSIRALLTGANLAVKVWPYTFYHDMRLSNAFPESEQDKSPIQLANPDGKPEDLSKLRTFGCRTWVKPPGAKIAKFVPNSRKGIFLGYVPYLPEISFGTTWKPIKSKLQLIQDLMKGLTTCLSTKCLLTAST